MWHAYWNNMMYMYLLLHPKLLQQLNYWRCKCLA